MKKNVLALILTLAMALSLAACGGGSSGGSDSSSGGSGSSGDSGSSSGGDAQVYNIGICQLAPHPAGPVRHPGAGDGPGRPPRGLPGRREGGLRRGRSQN